MQSAMPSITAAPLISRKAEKHVWPLLMILLLLLAGVLAESAFWPSKCELTLGSFNSRDFSSDFDIGRTVCPER